MGMHNNASVIGIKHSHVTKRDIERFDVLKELLHLRLKQINFLFCLTQQSDMWRK